MIVETLNALQAAAMAAMPGVTVYNRPKQTAGLGIGPYLILSAFDYHEEEVATWTREQMEGDPNVYAFIYLQAPAKQQNRSEDDIVTSIYSDVEKFFGIFRVHANQELPDDDGKPQVSFAGRKVSARFYVEGPFIKYGGGVWLGCIGKVTVEETYEEDS